MRIERAAVSAALTAAGRSGAAVMILPHLETLFWGKLTLSPSAMRRKRSRTWGIARAASVPVMVLTVPGMEIKARSALVQVLSGARPSGLRPTAARIAARTGSTPDE